MKHATNSSSGITNQTKIQARNDNHNNAHLRGAVGGWGRWLYQLNPLNRTIIQALWRSAFSALLIMKGKNYARTPSGAKKTGVNESSEHAPTPTSNRGVKKGITSMRLVDLMSLTLWWTGGRGRSFHGIVSVCVVGGTSLHGHLSNYI